MPCLKKTYMSAPVPEIPHVTQGHSSQYPMLHQARSKRLADFAIRTLGSPSSAPRVPSHRHRLLLQLDILEEGDGALELPAVDGLGGFPCVLERHSEVRAARAGRLGRRDLGCCVSNLAGSTSVLES